MSIVNNNGITGTVLTADESETLIYFKYDPNTNELVATRTIRAELNSFQLGRQHKMSSGGENIFFTNLTADIDWFPAWSGVLDQSNLLNQGRSGIIAPSIRIYADLIDLEVYGPVSTGAVPYSDSVTLVTANSLFGLQFITEEAVAADDHITYNLFLGTDETGTEIYNQRFTGTAYNIGDTITLWFSHPYENMPGTTIYSQVILSVGTQDGIKHIMQVRQTAGGNHWSLAKIRGHSDAFLHHRRPIIHSSFGAYEILDRDGGREIHLETDDLISLDCTGITDNFELRIVNTSLAERSFTVTNAVFVGFRQGGDAEDLIASGTAIVKVPANATVLLFVTENSGLHFVNMVLFSDGGQRIEELETQVEALQNAETILMEIQFPPADGQNAFIISMPVTEGGYIFWDAQSTGNMQEVIWP